MSKKWLFILMLAFVFGFGLKRYLISTEVAQAEAVQSGNSVFSGVAQQHIDLFDTQDDRIRIVYFGFTHCPDVCPTSLAMLSAALKQLNQPLQQKIRPIFITLDPERDTAEKTHQYAQYFHPSIEGLSAPLATTKPLAEKYGVVFHRTELKESQLKYTIDHNSYFYLLKPNGELLTKIPHTLNPAPIVTAIKKLEQ